MDIIDLSIFLGLYIVFVIFMSIYILILIYVYEDAKRRGSRPFFWLYFVLLTGLIGLAIWLIVRPKKLSAGIICLLCKRKIKTSGEKTPEDVAREYGWHKVKIESSSKSVEGYICKECSEI